MAESLTIRIVGDATSYTRTIQQVEAGIRRASNATQQFGHGGVSSVQAISASIRLAEGGLNNMVRAAERFIARSQALSNIAKTIFPAVGFIAVGSIVAKSTMEVAKFIEQVNNVPKALQHGFQTITLSQQSANDALSVANDKLDMEIAKLEHKPANGMKLALDEAKVSADEFAKSLASDNEQITNLLKANKINFGESILTRMLNGTGEASTSDVSKQVTKFETRLQDLAYQRQQAVRNGGDTAGFDSQIATTRQQAHSFAQAEIVQRRASQGQFRGYDQSANLSILEGFDSNLTDREDFEKETSRNKSLDAQKTSDTARNEQARAAQEAESKAQEATIQGWHSSLDELKSVQDLTLSQEADFWIDRAAFVTNGSKSYATAIEEANKAIAGVRKDTGIERTKFDKENSASSLTTLLGENFDDAGLDKNQGRIKEQSSTSSDFLKNLDEGVNIQREQATALAEASLQMQVATGRMSTYDAAIVQAQLHTQEYTQQLALLQDALNNIHGNDGDAAKQRSEIENQISTLNGSRTIQSMQDNSAVNSQTLSGSFQDTMDLFVQKATDTAAQIKEIFTGAIDSINGALSQSLLAKEPNGREYRRNIENSLGSAFRSTGSSILNNGFKQVEGGALKALGLGTGKKPTGTASDPLYVRMTDGVPGSGSSQSGGLLGSIHSFFGGRKARGIIKAAGKPSGLDTDDSDDDSLPGISSIPMQGWLPDSMPGGGGLDTDNDTSDIGDIASIPLQGFFANGGDVVANRPAIVGDGGKPEVFVPGTSGHIYPDASAFGSSSVTHNHYVDARGASDPAAVQAAVDRSMRQYAPGIVQQSVKANREYHARRPSSKK